MYISKPLHMWCINVLYNASTGIAKIMYICIYSSIDALLCIDQYNVYNKENFVEIKIMKNW